jgi:hypothetical protein
MKILKRKNGNKRISYIPYDKYFTLLNNIMLNNIIVFSGFGFISEHKLTYTTGRIVWQQLSLPKAKHGCSAFSLEQNGEKLMGDQTSFTY